MQCSAFSKPVETEASSPVVQLEAVGERQQPPLYQGNTDSNKFVLARVLTVTAAGGHRHQYKRRRQPYKAFIDQSKLIRKN